MEREEKLTSFFWQFYWVSFLLPQQSHCVKKMVDFWTYDPTPDQPIPPPLPVMPHLAISALKTTQNYGVWSFFSRESGLSIRQ